jgi:hypothetical protein
MSARSRRTGPFLAAVAAASAVLLSGCGIRATEVPTDFGPAPSRMPCAVADPQAAPQPPHGLPVQVFLTCAARLVSVYRTVLLTDADAGGDGGHRVRVAQALLGELARKPSASERLAGYTTAVGAGTTVTGPRKGDPGDTLRLGVPPDDLTPYALAQIVCTFSDSTATEGDGSMLLGGPDGPVRRYSCTPDVRARPGVRMTPSAPVKRG